LSAFDFLRRVSQALDAAGVDYMVTGSFASTHYGEPRTTQDLDMVVRLEALGLERLLASLPEDDWYFSPEGARDALQRRRQFNLICQQTGWKADLIVQKDDAFAQAEFDRGRDVGQAPLGPRGRRLTAATPRRGGDAALAAWPPRHGVDRALGRYARAGGRVGSSADGRLSDLRSHFRLSGVV
jgi:hypothetical protein